MFDLSARRLYLCVGVRDDMTEFPRRLCAGVWTWSSCAKRTSTVDAQRRCARDMAPICREFDVPFIVNDSPELAFELGADGVHVGQDDVSVERCRDVLGDEAIVGLSTHSNEEFENALTHPASYFSAGPIVATPTKPGREGTGLDYALTSQRRSDRPVFVTGGVNEHNVADLVAAGLRHFVVVRALTESPDPEVTARSIRRALDGALAVAIEPT